MSTWGLAEAVKEAHLNWEEKLEFAYCAPAQISEDSCGGLCSAWPGLGASQE